MTPRPALAKLAMRALADEASAPVPPTRREAEDAIAAIARAISDVAARRKRRARVLVGLAVAASLVLGIAAAWQRDRTQPTASVEDVSGGVMLVRGDHGVTLGRGTGIAKGDRVVATAEGMASLRLRKGTELRATRGADVAVIEQGEVQIYELRAGTVHLHVAKLATGERFLVRTGDAEVEVRGTEFDVDVREPCEGTTTRVAVSEGTVVVRHAGVETRVTVGESWPAACGAHAAVPTNVAAAPVPPPAPAPSPAPDREVSMPPARSTSNAAATPADRAPHAALTTTPPAGPPAAGLPPPLPAPASSSSLGEQNRLFADAMACKRRGDAAGALAALDGLTSAYPQGALAESAYVEKMRVLATADRQRAGDAARSYLARFPNGYARDEARALTAR